MRYYVRTLLCCMVALLLAGMLSACKSDTDRTPDSQSEQTGVAGMTTQPTEGKGKTPEDTTKATEGKKPPPETTKPPSEEKEDIPPETTKPPSEEEEDIPPETTKPPSGEEGDVPPETTIYPGPIKFPVIPG